MRLKTVNMATGQDHNYRHILKYTGIFGGVQGFQLVMGLLRTKLMALLLGPTDYELPIQVTADLIDHRISYEGSPMKSIRSNRYKDIEDMVENGLVGLDFDDLVDVPDDVIERPVPGDRK